MSNWNTVGIADDEVGAALRGDAVMMMRSD